MKFVIIIFGPPCTGKSTFMAQILKKLPSLYYLSVDELQERQLNDLPKLPALQHGHVNLSELFDKVQRGFTQQLHHKIRSSLPRLAQHVLKQGPLLIQDELLTAKQRHRISRYGEKWIQVLMECDIEQAVERQQKRGKVTKQVILKSFQRLQTDCLTLKFKNASAFDFQNLVWNCKAPQVSSEILQSSSLLLDVELGLRKVVGQFCRLYPHRAKQAAKLKNQYLALARSQQIDTKEQLRLQLQRLLE